MEAATIVSMHYRGRCRQVARIGSGVAGCYSRQRRHRR